MYLPFHIIFFNLGNYTSELYCGASIKIFFFLIFILTWFLNAYLSAWSSSDSCFIHCSRDLLYKPIVLGKDVLLDFTFSNDITTISFNLLLLFAACGHISCFWCVHKAMHGLRASHCPLCRQPYIHFPGICQLLHHLLLKMEPVAYKRRESEVLGEFLTQRKWTLHN